METTTNPNTKTHLMFATLDATHFDTAHGRGFGAWMKMWNRTCAALFADPTDWRLVNADDKSALLVRNRVTGVELTVTCVEVTK